MNLEMPHLRELEKMAPRTAIGRVVAAWPHIRANLAAGKKLREVYMSAARDGIDLPYAQFRVYVHRLRKRDQQCSLPPGSGRRPTQAGRVGGVQQQPSARVDPLRSLRELREKTKSFEYNPFPREGLTK